MYFCLLMHSVVDVVDAKNPSEQLTTHEKNEAAEVVCCFLLLFLHEVVH